MKCAVILLGYRVGLRGRTVSLRPEERWELWRERGRNSFLDTDLI